MNLRRTPPATAAVLALAAVLAAPAVVGSTNPPGPGASSCPGCSVPDGTSTGVSSIPASRSFEWSINLGLARYPKPASFAGLGSAAYERDGTLPTFHDLVGRYFPSGPLQQSQIPMRINQPMITAATFHPSCLMLDSEAVFERISKNDGGSDHIHQVVTDDAFTQIDILAAGANPPGITGANNGPVTVGAGWQIRVWRKPAGFQKPPGSAYYAPPAGTPLANAVFCRPNVSNPGDNTLLFILKESTGIEARGFSLRTAVFTQTTVDVGGILRPDLVTIRVYPSVVTVPATAGTPVSEETVDYRNHGSGRWDYTLDRTEKVASITNGSPGALFVRSASTEVYEDFSANSAEGGEPGMKRLMSRTDNGRTTTYDYYDTPQVPFLHGRPRSEVRPDGSWKAWDYWFGTAPVFTEYSSWLDEPVSGKEQARKTVTTVYGDQFSVETYVAGQLVARSDTSLSLSGSVLSETRWAGDAPAPDPDSRYTTVTVYNPDSTGTGSGRIASVTHPDGTRTTYTYGGSADAQVVTEVSGSTDSPSFARKTVTTYNSGGIAVARESSVVADGVETGIDGESWEVDTTGDPVFDTRGRPVRVVYGDGTSETDEYACCGLGKHISRDGTATEYFRDDLRRVWKVSTDPAGPAPASVTTTDVTYGTLPYHSLAGITTTRYLGEGSGRVFLGATTVTLDGMTTVTEEPSLKSTSADDRRVTYRTASAGSATASHKRRGDSFWTADTADTLYLDGRIKSGVDFATGGMRTYYYGPHSLPHLSRSKGGLCTSVYQSGRWYYDYRDMLGRTIRAVAPESGATTYAYHGANAAQASARGRLATVTDADAVTVDYGYPSANKRTVTRAVLATTGTTTAPVPLITETTETIGTPAAINGITLGISLKSETKAGQTGSMTPVSTSYRALNGNRSATVSPDGSATVTETPLPNISTGVSTTTVTRADGTRTRTTTTPAAPGSTVKTELLTSGAGPTAVEWTESVYDPRGRPVSSKDSRTGEDGKTTFPATHLTESGTPLRVIRGGRQTDYEYDYEGRLIKVDAPDTGSIANVTHTSYWPTGLVKARWGDRTNPVWYQYDAFGRMTIQYTWKSDPGLTQNTAPAPNTTGNPRVPTTWSYGYSTGRLDYKRDAANNDLKYYYTSAGRLQSRVSARGITTYYYYDTGGNLRAVDYPATSSTPDILHTRDNLGRQTSAIQGTLTVTGGTGTVSNSGISLSATLRSAAYGYNANLQLSTETTNPGGGFSRTLTRCYDAYGRPRSLAVGTDHTTAYGYDTVTGRLTQVWDNPALNAQGEPSGAATFTYGYVTGSGLLHTVTKAASGSDPALVATRTWDTTRDVLLTIENKAGETVRSSYTYTVNDIGQRTAVTTGGSEFTGSPADWSWRYDALGQLEKAALGTTGDKGRNYQYDATGNRVTSAAGNWNADLTAFTASSTASYYGVLSNGTPSAPGANTLNQYAAIRGRFTADPVHDYDGNMTSGPVPGTNGNTPGVQAPANATNMVWDAENRLVSATVAGVTHTYAYDAFSRLVSRSVGVPPTSTTYYLYDGWNRIAGYDGTGVLQDTFTWGLDLSGSMRGAGGVGGLLATRWASFTGSPTYYPAYDGNGNISEYLAAAGTAAAHYEYDPFGMLTRLTGSDSTRFQYRFSTKPRDPSTGLYYYGYRWYDPLTGRWPSRDPIGERGGYNLYGFVGNDGVDWVDFLGMDAWLQASGKKAQLMLDQDGNPARKQASPWEWGFLFRSVKGLTGCAFEVSIPVKLPEGNKAREAFVRMQQGVKNVWDNKYQICCGCKGCPIRVTLDVKGSGFRHKIGTMTQDDIITDAEVPNTGKFLIEDTTDSRIEPKMTVETTAAHEIGHLLGNPDNYNNKGLNRSAGIGNLIWNQVPSEGPDRGGADSDYGMLGKAPFTLLDDVMNFPNPPLDGDGNQRLVSRPEHFNELLKAVERRYKKENCKIIPVNQSCTGK